MLLLVTLAAGCSLYSGVDQPDPEADAGVVADPLDACRGEWTVEACDPRITVSFDTRTSQIVELREDDVGCRLDVWDAVDVGVMLHAAAWIHPGMDVDRTVGVLVTDGTLTGCDTFFGRNGTPE